MFYHLFNIRSIILNNERINTKTGYKFIDKTIFKFCFKNKPLSDKKIYA